MTCRHGNYEGPAVPSCRVRGHCFHSYLQIHRNVHAAARRRPLRCDRNAARPDRHLPAVDRHRQMLGRYRNLADSDAAARRTRPRCGTGYWPPRGQSNLAPTSLRLGPQTSPRFRGLRGIVTATNGCDVSIARAPLVATRHTARITQVFAKIRMSSPPKLNNPHPWETCTPPVPAASLSLRSADVHSPGCLRAPPQNRIPNADCYRTHP